MAGLRGIVVQRIGEAALFPGPTLTLSVSLWLATQLLETLVGKVLPLFLLGTPSIPGAVAG